MSPVLFWYGKHTIIISKWNCNRVWEKMHLLSPYRGTGCLMYLQLSECKDYVRKDTATLKHLFYTSIVTQRVNLRTDPMDTKTEKMLTAKDILYCKGILRGWYYEWRRTLSLSLLPSTSRLAQTVIKLDLGELMDFLWAKIRQRKAWITKIKPSPNLSK